MSTEESKLLRDILDRIGDLRSIISPIIPDSLATLDGWTWKSEMLAERAVLARGGAPLRVIPDIQNEKGWLNTLMIVFSDPYSTMRFQCDNWTFILSPYLVNMIGLVQSNNATIYCTVYNPATPLGPLYGVAWQPSNFWPYKSQIMFTAQHPATAPTATSHVVMAGLGRHFIRDERQFYESIFIDAQRQTIGKVEVPIRRTR